jgi:lipopolysaccharide cholinephosphotransferase
MLFKFLILLILLITIPLITTYLNTKQKLPIEKVNHKYLKDYQVDEIYSMIKVIHDIFEKESIEYYIIGGTLIGSVRHGGLIPWDDDIDIGVNEIHENFIKSDYFRLLLQQNNLKLDTFVAGYKISPLDSLKFKKECDWCTWNFPFIDIFLVKKEGDKFIYANKTAHNWWPDYFDYNELYPIKNCKFGPYVLKCPNNPEPFLKRSYGNDVFTHYYEQYDHKLEIPRKKIKKKLNKIQVVYPNLKKISY